MAAVARVCMMVCVCVYERRKHPGGHCGAIGSPIGAAGVCVVPSCEWYATSQTDMLRKTHHVGGHQCRGPGTQGLILSVSLPSSVPLGIELMSPEQELG